MLGPKGSCAAVRDHLRFHQQNRNHALVVKAVEKITQHKRLGCEIPLVAIFHDQAVGEQLAANDKAVTVYDF